jgi:hypothetical protein
MRKFLPVLLMILPTIACADDGPCAALGDELNAAFEEMDDGDPTVEDFRASSEANQRWKAAGCDE